MRYVIVLIFLTLSCTSYQVVQRESRLFAPSDKSGENYAEKNDHQPCRKLSEGVFIVQVGAFHNISYAQDLRKKLEGVSIPGAIPTQSMPACITVAVALAAPTTIASASPEATIMAP